MNKSKSKLKTKKRNLVNQLASKLPKSERYEYEGLNFDRMFHASISKFGNWLSPAALLLAYIDWIAYLNISPAKRFDLANNALKKIIRFLFFSGETLTKKSYKPCISVRKNDHRFQNLLWKKLPFNLYSQAFLLNEQWWDEATTHMQGVSKHHQNLVNFITRQILDIFAPSNIPWMNPEVIEAFNDQYGMNFIKGFTNFIEDSCRNINGESPVGTDKYKIGIDVATTPGKVIYRNQLIELIQYQPTTSKVYAEPILIIPAWIMKYYILDLSSHNSMVRYLINQGHTVFMISWKNPTSADRDLDFSDYAQSVLDSLEVIQQIIPKRKIHTVGYCIGGTLLMMVAAYLAKKSVNCLKSITLFAAEVDFKDAGELLLFIDEKQISYLEDIMWEKGYLDGSQMAGAFSMLRSIDLIWSRGVRDYLLGQRQPVSDLMAWDYDTTRLPYKMHTEYLRNLFLNNDLVQGRFKILGKEINLTDIKVPIFAVSTVKDHVAPWKSVYKIHSFTDTDITFVLTNAGHNTGIVNAPGQSGRTYQMLTDTKETKHLAPEIWEERAPHSKGSWWPAWEEWIADHSGNKVKPPSMGNPDKELIVLCDAPGTYIFQK